MDPAEEVRVHPIARLHARVPVGGEGVDGVGTHELPDGGGRRLQPVAHRRGAPRIQKRPLGGVHAVQIGVGNQIGHGNEQ